MIDVALVAVFCIARDSVALLVASPVIATITTTIIIDLRRGISLKTKRIALLLANDKGRKF
jgi:hypothetical protein